MEFKKDDLVEYAGMMGKVTGQKTIDGFIEVHFKVKESDKYLNFTRNGRVWGFEPLPVLTLVGRLTEI